MNKRPMIRKNVRPTVKVKRQETKTKEDNVDLSLIHI